MGIKLSLKDQIILLRYTAKNIDEYVKYIAKVDFDEQLLDCVKKILTIEDVVFSSHALTLKIEDSTDSELESLRQEAISRVHMRTIPHESIFDGRRVWE